MAFQYSCLENSTDRLEFMGPQRVRHDRATEHTHAHTHTPLVQWLAPPASIKHTFPSPCICIETIYLANQPHPLVLGPKIQKQKQTNKNRRISLEGHWLRFCASTTRAPVRYLVRGLRSHMPCIREMASHSSIKWNKMWMVIRKSNKTKVHLIYSGPAGGWGGMNVREGSRIGQGSH